MKPQLTQEQLEVALRMEALGDLAGGIAHDFNNLLTGVIGFSELLLEKLDAADNKRAYAEEIHRAGTRAAELTAELLALGRRQVLRPKSVDLNALVHATERLLRPVVGERVELAIRLAPDLVLVEADPIQLERVLLSLAGHARDAMPAGGRLAIATSNAPVDSIESARHPGLQAGEYAVVSLTDSGPTMDRADQARIFEPFFTRRGQGKQAGLALAAAYGIVKQSGGHIEVESELVGGVTFRVYLPRALERAAEERPLPGGDFQPGTVLIVEDEETVRALARAVLEGEGFKVLVAESGEQALEISSQMDARIDILLTDIVMPGMSGAALADHLRLSRIGLNVVYMSGYARGDTALEPYAAAKLPILEKPFTSSSLLRAVREALDNGAGWQTGSLAQSGG